MDIISNYFGCFGVHIASIFQSWHVGLQSSVQNQGLHPLWPLDRHHLLLVLATCISGGTGLGQLAPGKVFQEKPVRQHSAPVWTTSL